MRRTKLVFGLAVLVFTWAAGVSAAELKMYDGARLGVLVDGYDGKGNLAVYLTSGEKKPIALRDVSTIYYSGRTPRFIRSGDQRFVFNAGGAVCGGVDRLEKGETLHVLSQSLGRLSIPLKYLHGFTALTVRGRASRMAEDLLRDKVPTAVEIKKAATERRGKLAKTRAAMLYLDHFLDRRGVPYVGILENFTGKNIVFENDEHSGEVRLQTFKLAGVRLADAEKEAATNPDWTTLEVRVGVSCLDGSYLIGSLLSVDPFQWLISPSWDPARKIAVPTNEIAQVDILGGRAVYLSSLKPVKVEEKTELAPPQPYRNNTNSQGESMDIGGFIYHNGIGVHASSKLTYMLGGRFGKFLADVGIDGRLERDGTVIFSVLGDGKTLFKSKLVRGHSAGGGLPIAVPVKGIKQLTLVVDATDDLDQADLANWGGARVVR